MHTKRPDSNKLSALWPSPRLRDPYLTRLLMDSRDGAREGFPAAVAAEIAALLGSAELPVVEHPWGHIKSAQRIPRPAWIQAGGWGEHA